MLHYDEITSDTAPRADCGFSRRSGAGGIQNRQGPYKDEMRQFAQILLVDPDPESARSFTDTLGQLEYPNQVARAFTSDQALRMLEDRERFWRQNPDLILLDVSARNNVGIEVLAYAKGIPLFRAIPVIVFAAPADHEQIRRAYDLHANVVLAKPAGFAETWATLDAVCRVWIKLALEPRVREME